MRGHNPEKCGKNCERCRIWIDYRTPKPKKNKGIKLKAGNEPKRGHNPEKCGKGAKDCVRCAMWIEARTPKSKRKNALKVTKSSAKDLNLTGFGRLQTDLDGNIIIPYEARAILDTCSKCKKECKQREPAQLMYCPMFDPINPRTRRTKAEMEADAKKEE